MDCRILWDTTARDARRWRQRKKEKAEERRGEMEIKLLHSLATRGLKC